MALKKDTAQSGGVNTCEELVRDYGYPAKVKTLSTGLERAGIHVVIANEIMPDFAATPAANHPDTNVINEDIHRFKEEA